MNFITIHEEIITGVFGGDIHAGFSGTPYDGHERVPMPEGADAVSGDPVAAYDRKTWKRRPLADLVREGLIEIPAGAIIDGENFRAMTQDEKYERGIGIPEGMKYENGTLVKKTDAEKIADGDCTCAECAEQEFDRRLSKLMNREAKARAEIDEGYAALRKEKMRALFAVKDKQGWPERPEWPEE